MDINVPDNKITINMSEEEFELLYKIFDFGRISQNEGKHQIYRHFGHWTILDEESIAIWKVGLKLNSHRKTSI